MKKLLGLVLFVGMSHQAYAGGFVGSFGGSFDTSDPTVEYIVVKNGESTTVGVGSLMKPSASSDDGVTVLLTTLNLTPAVCVMAESCATGKFCKCQTYGYTATLDVSGGETNIAAGAVVTPAAGDGTGTGLTTGVPVAIALDASTATESIEAFIILR